MGSMAEHLNHVDDEKLHRAYDIQCAYESGKLSLSEAQERMKTDVQRIAPWELAYVEQQFKPLDEDECKKERIQDMLVLFEEILVHTPPELPENHSIARYYQENQAWRDLLDRVAQQTEKPFIKNQWLELYDELKRVRLHFSRKQNQLYAMLEQKGFTRPTDTMWLLDDFIYDEIAEIRDLLERDQDQAFLDAQQQLIDDCLDLIQKEETVLYPTSLQLISTEEFALMVPGDDEIGYSWITVDISTSQKDEVSASKRAANMTQVNAEVSGPQAALLRDMAKLLETHGVSTPDTELDVAMGKLTLEQINLIFKHLAVDLSYVDEHELVKFYSDTKHRVFPRSRGVIGRKVQNCHPRTSVHIVEEVIETFRSGKQDQVEFWINKPDAFIYVLYTAVRDDQGAFRGVLEMMQDCTHIRSLEGSRTLLTWENEVSQKEERPETEPSDKESVSAEVLENNSSNILDTMSEQTRLVDLLEAYPFLLDELPNISSTFSMLKTPLARVMIPRATIAIMSSRSGMAVDELIEKIKQCVQDNYSE